jgi:NAD(P)-dependent dehydrogenase (short-subunit alcohol dehydrogenase family)
MGGLEGRVVVVTGAKGIGFGCCGCVAEAGAGVVVADIDGEHYLEELAALLQVANGRPEPAAVAELHRRHDIEQLTALRSGGSA